MPESYVFCKGVQMTIVADQLDNAGFNAIAKSPLLEPTYIINQGKTPLQMDVTAAVSSLSLCRIILPCFCLSWLYLNVCFVCDNCIAI